MDSNVTQSELKQNWMMRILGYVTTPMQKKFLKPNENKKMVYTRVMDFEMPVTPQTTVRDIKDFSMARHPSLHYYQLRVEFFAKTQKDAYTLKDIEEEDNILYEVNCIYLLITLPNKKFKATYKTFCDIGMTEEDALEETNNFMNNVYDKNSIYEHDLVMYIEQHQLLTNPSILQNLALQPEIQLETEEEATTDDDDEE